MKKKFQRHPPESISQMLHSAHFLHILLHTAHIRACAFQSKITSSLFFFFLFFLKKKRTEALYQGANRCTMEVHWKTRMNLNSLQR